jgi:hypothetical protein
MVAGAWPTDVARPDFTDRRFLPMAATATIASAKHLSKDASLEVISFPLVFSGSYVNNGDTLDLSALPFLGLARVPLEVRIKSLAGYVYFYDQGTTAANGKVRVHVNTSAGANLPLPQHTVAAYNAGVTGDTVTCVAYFTGGRA